jgi:hypothetical protein
MTTNATPAQESAGTTDAQISGPHPASDRYGGRYTYFRCEACGVEASQRRTLAQGGCDCHA